MPPKSFTAGSRETSVSGQQNLGERDNRRIESFLAEDGTVSRMKLRLFINRQLKAQGFEGGLFFKSNPPSAVETAFSREAGSSFAPHKRTKFRVSTELIADFVNKMFPNANAGKRRLLTSLMGQDKGVVGLTN